MENFEEPDWAEGVIRKLQEDLDQGAAGFKIWKDIGMTFRDRLIYATDAGVSQENVEDQIQWLENEWRSDWSYFGTDSLLSSRNVENDFRGLDLSEKVLRKIYYTNAIEWYPGIFE